MLFTAPEQRWPSKAPHDAIHPLLSSLKRYEGKTLAPPAGSTRHKEGWQYGSANGRCLRQLDLPGQPIDKKERQPGPSLFKWCEWEQREDPLATLAHFEPYRFGAGVVPDPVQIAAKASTITAKQHHGKHQYVSLRKIKTPRNNLCQRKRMKHHPPSTNKTTRARRQT